MPSNKFSQIAKKIAKKDTELFDTLIEFEQTKKLRTKTRLNFTINKSLASQFRKLCRKKGYNMSSKIEQAIQEMMGRD